jgi:hypothetical protein
MPKADKRMSPDPRDAADIEGNPAAWCDRPIREFDSLTATGSRPTIPRDGILRQVSSRFRGCR